jgi:hypothetical protein
MPSVRMTTIKPYEKYIPDQPPDYVWKDEFSKYLETEIPKVKPLVSEIDRLTDNLGDLRIRKPPKQKERK